MTFASLLGLAAVGSAYQAIASGVDRRSHPAPGRMVDVGGHKMHINCTGEGSPTVILESGNGGMSSQYAVVQQQIARSTRVCSYDRSGLGWSEPAPQPRHARQIAGELHTLLVNANIEGPYLLVAHSYGGFYARMYAGQYPDEVAGIVLVDSSHPEQFTRSAEGRAMYKQIRMLTPLASVFSRLGVIRLTNYFPADPHLAAAERAQVEVFNSSTRHLDTSGAEFKATPVTVAQVKDLPSLGDLPLAVVTAGEQPAEWLVMQAELAKLSTNSSHVVIAGATHGSLVSESKDVQATGDVVSRIVEALRAGR